MALNLEKVIPLAMLDVNANVSMVASAPGGGIAVDNPQVLRVDQATDITFTWTAGGLFGPLFLFFPFPMEFDAFYELMGPGEAVIAVPTSVATTSTAPGQTITLTLAANTVPAGVYRIVIRMKVILPPSTTPTIIAGFEELGLIEYYDI
jgi:hypothetical protein